MGIAQSTEGESLSVLLRINASSERPTNAALRNANERSASSTGRYRIISIMGSWLQYAGRLAES
ncbi:MAG: hypothetical protein IPM12_03270 [Flavobacteriales bacterium]|nr:hypothetical protein [Flavobacteriales bacterium]